MRVFHGFMAQEASYIQPLKAKTITDIDVQYRNIWEKDQDSGFHKDCHAQKKKKQRWKHKSPPP